MYVCMYDDQITCILATLATSSSDLKCNVRTRIDTGWVCGLLRRGEYDVKYASFRGVPYAQQPLKELRFKVLYSSSSQS